LQNNAGNYSISAHVKSLFETRIKQLNDLTEQIGKKDYAFKEEALIPQVFRKFKGALKSGKDPIFERKELRTLAYSLSHSENNLRSIYDRPKEMEIAFKMLNLNWKDSYFIGLFNCYLKNWGMGDPVSFNALHEFCYKKLSQYTGERKAIKYFKNNEKFFDPIKGDVVLGSELALKRKSLNEAAKYLSLPDSWFTYPYFSKVIEAFYEKNKEYIDNLLPEIEKALLSHSSNTRGSITSKRVISKIIIQCNEIKNEHLQDAVKDMALKLIGDPALVANWSIDPNTTAFEKTEQKRAMEILNMWITRQFITVFFEKCIKDPRRKNFWLQIAKHISDFKVFGPENIRRDLINIKSISKLVDSRFKVTLGTRANTVSAFLMQVGDYKLIEFSDQGKAFYAYKKSSAYAPSFDKKYNTVSDFIDSSMPMLIKISGTMLRENADEGRLFHKDGDLKWEAVFLRWIRNKLNINV